MIQFPPFFVLSSIQAADTVVSRESHVFLLPSPNVRLKTGAGKANEIYAIRKTHGFL